MTLCRKTLILLLLVSLVPLMLGVGVQRYSTWKLGRYLADGTRDRLARDAEILLRTLVTDYQKMVVRDAEKLELALRVQVREAERLLAETPKRRPVFFSDAFDGEDARLELIDSPHHHTLRPDGTHQATKVSLTQAVTYLVKGVSFQDVQDDIDRLAPMVDLYRALYSWEDMVWQYTSLESGVHVSFPGHGGYPEGYDPRKRAWYRKAQESGGVSWEIVSDATTGALTPVVSMPVHRGDGSFAGVCAIDVPLATIFEELVIPEDWAKHARAMLVMVEPDAGGLLILAENGPESQDLDWARPVTFDVLDSPDTDQLTALKDAISKGESGVLRMRFQERESLWAFASGEVQVVVIVPYDRVIESAVAARDYVLQRTIRGLQYSGLFFLAVFAGVFFLSFRLARKLTSPVRQLAEASSQLAEGAYDVRVDIRTGDEFEHLGEIFNQTGPKLRERERMKHSLHLANEIQQNLLPSAPPEIPGFDIAGKSVYCEETGGDYFDFIDLVVLNGSRLGIAVGDVSGHGIGAALLMASARAVLRANAAYLGDRPEELFASLNRHLSRDTGNDQFMTLFFGILDASKRCLTWVSGGHDPALLLRQDTGELSYLENTGMLLGVIEETEFARGGPVSLQPGDLLFIGTDGIWEARNLSGEFFGKGRLEALLRSQAHRSAEEIRREVVRCVREHSGGRPQDDDITLVVIKVQ